jgi:alpha-beta hydrolase superfamily lysophospholipase
MHDLQGNGKTPGKRGVAPGGYLSMLEDIDIVRSRIAAEQPDVPCFLYGHSLGGNLVANHLLRNKVSDRYTKVVITSPFLRLHQSLPQAMGTTLRIIGKAMPQFTLHRVLRPYLLSHDIEFLAEINQENLHHSLLSAQLLMEILDAGEYAITNAGRLDLPTLVLQGEADQIIDIRGTYEFIKQADKKVSAILYPDQYHELQNETIRDLVFHDILSFLETDLADA